MRERIEKLGTIDLDLVETTPVVFKGKVYRFEYVRPGYSGNADGVSFFRFVEGDTGASSPPFARDYHLGNVMVEGDTLYVTGTNKWDGDRVDLFVSSDMENWKSRKALELPGYGLFNTSLCRADEKYVLMFEVGRPPEVAGVRFTALFAVSKDMERWEVLPEECCHAKDRYTAPHCLRFLDRYYYNFYLEAVSGGYEQCVVRSKDLIQWESSPLNPVLRASDEDRRIANPSLTPEQQERIRTAVNINNSDIDFCEFQGRLVINYSWGNQNGVEHLAEARFDGTLKEFLIGWFPESK